MNKKTHRVDLTSRAKRDLRRLKTTKAQATKALLKLETKPLAGEALKGSLLGARSLHWRAAKTDYRAAYVVQEEEQVCLVFLISTRENFYKAAERRWTVVKKT